MDNNQFTTKILDVIVSEDENTMFMVMDFMDLDLKNTLNATKKIEINEKHVIKLTYNFLCSLAYLHSANIMHRDIKPSNLLIDSNCNVKLCDFGLSRSIQTQNQSKRQKGEKISNNQICRELVSSRKERSSKKRSMSNHVISRWYRPPEVIVLDKSYD